MKIRDSESVIKEVSDRGFIELVSSEEKALADRLVREEKLIFINSLPNGGKLYKPAPPPKEKKSITCKGCGHKFKAWTAGRCGKCKK